MTEIGWYAFSGCTGLKSVVCPCTNPVPVEGGAFYEIRYQAKLIVPRGCRKLFKNLSGWNDFENIEELVADTNCDGGVNTADVTAVYSYIINGSDTDNDVLFEDVNGDGDVNTADVTAIYNYILTGEIDNNDDDINNPDRTKKTVKKTASGDYTDDVLLYTITDSYNCEVAGLYSSNASNIDIPDYIVYDGKSYCVKKIKDRAFDGNNDIVSVSIPHRVKEIGVCAFYACTNLKTISMVEGLVNIDTDAFKYCSSVEEVVIPNGVARIDMSAFEGCTNLKSIVMPTSLEEMGARVFRYCSNLQQVTALKKDPAEYYADMSDNIFKDCATVGSSCVLYVPTGSKSVYASTYPWSQFGNNIVEKDI